MINNLEEKEFLNKQIMHLENALADLKDKLLPHNPEMFEIMSSSYIEKIKEFRSEIDEFIGFQVIEKIDRSDIVIRLQGPEIGFGNAPISVVSSILEEVRKGFQNLYSFKQGYRNLTKIPNYISKACDMSLTNVREGSLQIALQRPTEQLSLLDEKTDFERTAELYLTAASWAASHGSVDAIKKEIPDIELREMALKSVLRLIPNSSKKINRVHLYGSLIKKDIFLTKITRDYIIENLSKEIEEEVIYTFEGRVREVDLDKGSFRLRELKGEENINEIIGHISDSLLDDLKENLDDVVVIRGILKNETVNSKTIQIRFIEKA
ncbi:hypothetical protein [Virgibacillus salinus]|uniref:Uncharacterized protein n=1 Tax=Virgibacillus salinus TaxID=553311 RepID=A0A1H0XVV5_9BACI|nr:hypothetical protein [Virgibacillus salinus]SDQ06995.1 hypothetical protein SAMN05216231_0243 [Virgibacillus salinus]